MSNADATTPPNAVEQARARLEKAEARHAELESQADGLLAEFNRVATTPPTDVAKLVELAGKREEVMDRLARTHRGVTRARKALTNATRQVKADKRDGFIADFRVAPSAPDPPTQAVRQEAYRKARAQHRAASELPKQRGGRLRLDVGVILMWALILAFVGWVGYMCTQPGPCDDISDPYDRAACEANEEWQSEHGVIGP